MIEPENSMEEDKIKKTKWMKFKESAYIVFSSKKAWSTSSLWSYASAGIFAQASSLIYLISGKENDSPQTTLIVSNVISFSVLFAIMGKQIYGEWKKAKEKGKDEKDEKEEKKIPKPLILSSSIDSFSYNPVSNQENLDHPPLSGIEEEFAENSRMVTEV